MNFETIRILALWVFAILTLILLVLLWLVARCAKRAEAHRLAAVEGIAVPTEADPPHDQLEGIDGIGPTIGQWLREENIHTFAELAALSIDKLRQILAKHKDGISDPASWPVQARLLERKNIEGFYQLAVHLVDSGRVPLEAIEGIGHGGRERHHTLTGLALRACHVKSVQALSKYPKHDAPKLAQALRRIGSTSDLIEIDFKEIKHEFYLDEVKHEFDFEEVKYKDLLRIKLQLREGSLQKITEADVVRWIREAENFENGKEELFLRLTTYGSVDPKPEQGVTYPINERKFWLAAVANLKEAQTSRNSPVCRLCNWLKGLTGLLAALLALLYAYFQICVCPDCPNIPVTLCEPQSKQCVSSSVESRPQRYLVLFPVAASGIPDNSTRGIETQWIANQLKDVDPMHTRIEITGSADYAGHATNYPNDQLADDRAKNVKEKLNLPSSLTPKIRSLTMPARPECHNPKGLPEPVHGALADCDHPDRSVVVTATFDRPAPTPETEKPVETCFRPLSGRDRLQLVK